eukprot:CAMPEP_0201283170 /NCGR_PEP_ID=MMETSP1317-20130820/7807_1 /ASSEMBLY_ACC=CAM_ASM_000770 /TAXON_ID=187299 /ORGANISM="Undescribed Undescribed, Strain Undescribed" /LENGTH=107 /DNA_ID=CAMNT_0047598477 /DNA_START=637 /DNA_END=960 /DNA_ORIENTATION=+
MTSHIHTYAPILAVAVMRNTPKSLIFLYPSSSACSLGKGTVSLQMVVIINRLKAADPMIVPVPNSPASNPNEIVSMVASIISGAELPKAMRVRLATVPFQMSSLTSS